MTFSEWNSLLSQLFFYALTVAFVTLKLMGYITWSWWWVLSPLWIPAAVVITIFVIALVVLTIRS